MTMIGVTLYHSILCYSANVTPEPDRNEGVARLLLDHRAGVPTGTPQSGGGLLLLCIIIIIIMTSTSIITIITTSGFP